LNVSHFCNAATFARIARVLAMLAQTQGPIPPPSKLAAVAGISLASLSRSFRDWSGVDFDVFVSACDWIGRQDDLCGELRVFAASQALQLRGLDRLRDCVVDVYPQVGEAARWSGVLRYGCSPSPFGDCVLAWSEFGISHLEFFDSSDAPRALLGARWKRATFERDDRVAERSVLQLFGTARRSARRSTRDNALAVHLVGSDFQVGVWRALLARDSSETVTYRDLASAISRPRASRAVGTAVGSNRIGWLVPCHHVVRADGALGGFHWGVDRKRAMLLWESLRPE